MLRILRNLSLLLLVAALLSPTASAQELCGSCSGNCEYNGDDLGCGGAFSFCFIGDCFTYVCADPEDGMGVICEEET